MPITEVKSVQVVIGIIEGAGQQVLLTRRSIDAHQGGKWEFPGGKVEQGESPEVALARELVEEVNIQPVNITALSTVTHDYGDKRVSLLTYVVSSYTGEANANEGQAMQWVAADDLSTMDFPAANGPIIEAYLRRLGAG